MRHGFPGLGLLQGLRPTRRPQAGNEPAHHRPGWAAGGRPRMVPTFTRHRSTRSVASSTPTASPRLRRSPSAWPPHRRLHSASELTRIHQLAGHALHPGPYPPALSRHSSYGASPTGSLVVPPSDLACRTRPVWQSPTVPALSGLLPPSPAFPGSGCPQLRHAAATARRRRSLTSTRCHAPRGARTHRIWAQTGPPIPVPAHPRQPLGALCLA